MIPEYLKDTVRAAPLSTFWEDITIFLFKPKLIRHNPMVEAQFSQALTFTVEKCTDQLSVLILEQNESCFWNFLVFYDSMFSSLRQVNFRVITVFVVAEYWKKSGLIYELVIEGGITSVCSRSDKRTIGLCSYAQLAFVEVFGSLAPVRQILWMNISLQKHSMMLRNFLVMVREIVILRHDENKIFLDVIQLHMFRKCWLMSKLV